MNSNEGKQKFFVIYQITNLLNNMIYVGAHVTHNVNDKYMGSSKYLKNDMKEQGRHNFKKEILHIFDNKEDMMDKEAEIVNREFCIREDTYNRMIGGISDWSVLDMVCVKDKLSNHMLVYRDDPRYLSGELVHNTTGLSFEKNLVHVRDNEGNSFKVKRDDPRYLSGELVSYNKGMQQHPNASWVGRSHKDETKQKMSEKASKRTGSKNSMFGTCWITKDNTSKTIKKCDLEFYLEQGWVKGRKITSGTLRPQRPLRP